MRFNDQEYELKLYMEQFIGVSGGSSNFLRFVTDFYVLNEEVYDLQGNVVFGADESFPSYKVFALLRTTTEEYYNYTPYPRFTSLGRKQPLRPTGAGV